MCTKMPGPRYCKERVERHKADIVCRPFPWFKGAHSLVREENNTLLPKNMCFREGRVLVKAEIVSRHLWVYK